VPIILFISQVLREKVGGMTSLPSSSTFSCSLKFALTHHCAKVSGQDFIENIKNPRGYWDDLIDLVNIQIDRKRRGWGFLKKHFFRP
jgi:hypothetical protein